MTTENNIDNNLIEAGQKFVFYHVEDIAAKYRPLKESLLANKQGNWIEEHQKLDRAFIKDIEAFMATGILNNVKFIEAEDLKPLPPIKNHAKKEDFAEANYRKKIVYRSDDFIITYFRWGSKNEINPENPRFGAETPIHGHSLECAATGFIPKGLKAEDVTQVLQVTFDDHGKPVNIETLQIGKTALRKADTRSESEKVNSVDIDTHAVFNPSPNQTGFTLHIYLTKGIGLDKNGQPGYIDISRDDEPLTAINIRNSEGFVNKDTGKIKRGGEIVPLSHYTQKLPFEACNKQNLEQRM